MARGPATVLIVEDDVSVRTMLGRLFSLEGFIVRATCDGEAALHEVTAGCPDLIVLDYNLPGDDGLKVLSKLKTHCSGVKVLLVTGTDDPDVERQTLEAGAEFISKPLVMPLLLSQIQTLAGKTNGAKGQQ
jgi:two-component system, OmpR family, torCAD operon response regulator TorR